jgi:hypothetical protein
MAYAADLAYNFFLVAAVARASPSSSARKSAVAWWSGSASPSSVRLPFPIETDGAIPAAFSLKAATLIHCSVGAATPVAALFIAVAAGAKALGVLIVTVAGARRNGVMRFPADYFVSSIFGPQSNPALDFKVGRSLARIKQRRLMMSSRVSRLEICLLTMGSSTSSQSVSVGLRSGV